jgi:hypothetical protein
MLIQGQSGPSGVLAAGSPATVRTLADSTVGVADCHARYQEAVYRGNVYSVADTVGHVQPAGLSASPLCVSLYNPVGSNVQAVIWLANAVALVAWAAASAVSIATFASATATTGTALPAVNNKTGSSGGSVVRPLTTATLAAAPAASLWLLGAGLTGAITVETAAKVIGGWIDGAVVLQPGMTAVIVTSTASGTAGLWCSWIWEEIALNFG